MNSPISRMDLSDKPPPSRHEGQKKLLKYDGRADGVCCIMAMVRKDVYCINKRVVWYHGNEIE